MDLFNEINQQHDTPAAGKALISEPFLYDANFKRTVILLCEHDKETGTLGFILNRKLEITLSDVIDIETNAVIPLYHGGPVQNDTLHYLHSDENNAADSIDLGNGIYWGGNFDALRSGLELGILDTDKYRFFLGYSGWSKGQLEQELEIKSWFVTDINKEIVFGNSTNGTLWKNTLKGMGGWYRLLSDSPESPFLN